jgi:hypothetical protein
VAGGGSLQSGLRRQGCEERQRAPFRRLVLPLVTEQQDPFVDTVCLPQTLMLSSGNIIDCSWGEP